MPRFYCPTPLLADQELTLPEGAARHVQVRRMQPGMALTLFNGAGGEFAAQVVHMGKREVRVQVGAFEAIEREAAHAVHLVVGMPANERMDWLIEKATELGVARVTPLMTQYSVVRLHGERADKKRAHWHEIAASACEQCGRNRLPQIDLPEHAHDWFASQPTEDAAVARWVLSLQATGATPAVHAHHQASRVLSGPEGGLSEEEERAARRLGFQPLHLGNRVLRAETAALAALAYFTWPVA